MCSLLRLAAFDKIIFLKTPAVHINIWRDAYRGFTFSEHKRKAEDNNSDHAAYSTQTRKTPYDSKLEILWRFKIMATNGGRNQGPCNGLCSLRQFLNCQTLCLWRKTNINTKKVNYM